MSEGLSISLGPVGAALWGFFCLTIGALLGHWLSLGRERRKERNEVAQRIRGALLRNRDEPDLEDELPGPADIDLLAQMLPRRSQQGFRKAAAEYQKKARETHPLRVERAIGNMVVLHDPKGVVAAIDTLLPYTRYK